VVGGPYKYDISVILPLEVHVPGTPCRSSAPLVPGSKCWRTVMMLQLVPKSTQRCWTVMFNSHTANAVQVAFCMSHAAQMLVEGVWWMPPLPCTQRSLTTCHLSVVFNRVLCLQVS